MIDPLAPVLPAAVPAAPDRPPRYLTVPGPNGLHRVVRIDGKPLGYVPPPAPPTPDPLPEALGLRLFAPGELAALREKAARRTRIVPPAVRPPDAPVFTPDEIRTIRAAAGVSQRDPAAALGRARGTVAGREDGRRVPQPDGARALAALRARLAAAGAGAGR